MCTQKHTMQSKIYFRNFYLDAIIASKEDYNLASAHYLWRQEVISSILHTRIQTYASRINCLLRVCQILPTQVFRKNQVQLICENQGRPTGTIKEFDRRAIARQRPSCRARKNQLVSKNCFKKRKRLPSDGYDLNTVQKENMITLDMKQYFTLS